MTELKTLKNIESLHKGYVRMDMLKETAIEWVKASRTDKDLCDAFFKFFNILEEDLKEWSK